MVMVMMVMVKVIVMTVGGRKKQSEVRGGYLQWRFFVVIASVLGTGILALPVRLAPSGFTPFLVTYTIGLFMQTFILVYMVDMLQRTERAWDHACKDAGLDPTESDLHTMGSLFLSPVARVIFDAAVLLHFLSILISYALAGAQAYSEMLTAIPIHSSIWAMLTSPRGLIIPFAVGLALLVVFGQRVIQGVISLLTFAKGSLLVLLVGVTAYVGVQTGEHAKDDWTYIGHPFLIGTVALGGAPFVIPVIFKSVKRNKEDMRLFMISVVLGLIAVYVLTLTWCFYLLRIVPQYGEVSLDQSQQDGEIATVPLRKLISGEFQWVATLVTLFIMGSVTVSYVTIGTATKHVVDGIVRASLPHSLQSLPALGRCTTLTRALDSQRAREYLVYLLVFGLTLLIAFLNPKSFITVMDVFTSMALNLESGVFVVLMLDLARVCATTLHCDDVAFPAPAVFFHLRWVVFLYFVLAIVYDLAGVAEDVVDYLF
eukprot:TRINITY_DN8109_c0_g1_i1.p1 TRINITY_DN8109_c0_g1~~TRINITY_DN8109_c0_g1_i1.p1  ORF type:complete len:484 (-),score=99.41 TRINITY_DN8109_c0_g1_i1:177-1628(-)